MTRCQPASLRAAVMRGLVGAIGVWAILAAWMVYTAPDSGVVIGYAERR